MQIGFFFPFSFFFTTRVKELFIQKMETRNEKNGENKGKGRWILQNEQTNLK